MVRCLLPGKQQVGRGAGRCRQPHQTSPFDSGVCVNCYFYKMLPVGEFWRLHKEGYYLAPYNVGARTMRNLRDLRVLENLGIDWRQCLKQMNAEFLAREALR